MGNALYKSLPSREKENAHTKYYCPKEISVQTMQRFYAECEQLLWKELEALTQPDVDYTAREGQIKEMQIRSALDCADWALGQLNLRGRAMVQIMEAQEKNLQKTIAAIRKRGGKS